MYLGCVRDARGVALCLGSLHCPQVETVALDHNQKHQTPADRSPQDHSAGLRTVALRKKTNDTDSKESVHNSQSSENHETKQTLLAD